MEVMAVMMMLGVARLMTDVDGDGEVTIMLAFMDEVRQIFVAITANGNVWVNVQSDE